jgi:hypothetical protein
MTSPKSKTGFREEVVLSPAQIKKKIYFLATGNGCSSLQVQHSFEFPSYLINLLRAKRHPKKNHSVTFGYAHLLMVLES